MKSGKPVESKKVPKVLDFREFLGGKPFEFSTKELEDEYTFTERGFGLKRLYLGKRKTLLGEGTFGKVRMATKNGTAISYAIKTIDKGSLEYKGLKRENVILEIELLKLCDHQLINKSYQVYEDQYFFHLVLEFCNGGSLGKRVKNAKDFDICENVASQWVKSVLSAIAYIHSPEIGIIHRDIKPDNFFFHDEVLKLGDFGLAIRPNPNNAHGGKITRKVGTPSFMAPEIHLLPFNSRGYDASADLWSAGVVMIFILTAKYPFVNEDGLLLKDAIIDGRLPVWSSAQSNGLFTEVKEDTHAPSKQAQDLIRALLKPDPKQRLDAETALSHHWFSDNETGNLVQMRRGETLLCKKEFEDHGIHLDAFTETMNWALETGEKAKEAANEVRENFTKAAYDVGNWVEELWDNTAKPF